MITRSSTFYSTQCYSTKFQEATNSTLLYVTRIESSTKLESKNLESNLTSSKSSIDYSLSKIKAFKKQIESNKIYLEGLKQELQLGERTTLDVLNGEQELLESSLGLVMSYKEYFISYYELLFHLGKLNAKDLNLNVILFDDEKNYNSVKGKWLDIIE